VSKLDEARELADDFLFPTANDVDAMDVLPRSRLDRLAADGWYGVSSPAMGLSMEEAWPIVAAFAGGCATTTLVWLQHLGTTAACSYGPEHLRELAGRLAAGDVRGSVAFNGLMPNPRLRSRPDGESWVISGTAPWMSGWGLVDLIHCATRAPDDDVVWLLVDASDPGLRAERHRLLGLDASSTVTLHFDDVRVEADRLTSRFPWAEWPARDAMGLRGNGSMALGVAERCARLAGSAALQAEVADATAALDAADATAAPAARADAVRLALRCAAALIAHEGSGAVERGTHAERLLREAAVLEVFATRPSIRTALLDQLGT
jgi:alkylation response protein AidB-like acyl-CoA dehydrogenase